MAAIETHSDEKDGSLRSEVDPNIRLQVIRTLDERRKNALSHIDGAKFSSAVFTFHTVISC